ncbi:MAG: ABC transporter permease [bacterium]
MTAKKEEFSKKRLWGAALSFDFGGKKFQLIDLFVFLGICALIYGILSVGHSWVGSSRASMKVDLSPWALPRYTFYSMVRGLAAYLLSLAFTVWYGYVAAKNKTAERFMVPLLDILQSIPVLGFMPGAVIVLVSLFPDSNIGLELAAILLIFTGQVWNMTFSFYYSVRYLPASFNEVAGIYRFSKWQRFKWIELPYSAISLIWNSIMSMAGGWFFLMICETFVLGSQDYRLPGVGSYMSVAVAEGNIPAMVYAVLAMLLMIVLLDQFLWRPVVVWSNKFRLEESAGAREEGSFFLDWLKDSSLLSLAGAWLRESAGRIRKGWRSLFPGSDVFLKNKSKLITGTWLKWVLLAGMGAGFLSGAWRFLVMVSSLPFSGWKVIVSGAALTLGRVLITIVLGSLWTIPVGLKIGLSERLSRIFQPVIQILASFPAPMLYPMVISGLVFAHVGLNWGSIILMVMGTQWYLLFNVIAGATAIPHELKEATRTFNISGSQRWREFYLPAIFPYLVTGFITAAGGAWNASIVAEYVVFRGERFSAAGIGSLISFAAERADFPQLAACLLVMAAVVVAFNRLVWKPLHRFSSERFSLVS